MIWLLIKGLYRAPTLPSLVSYATRIRRSEVIVTRFSSPPHSMAKKATASSDETSMRGEGFPVQVQFTRLSDEKTESRFQLNVLGAPTRIFFSDAIHIRVLEHGTRIGFIQTDYSGKRARALLEIYMTREAAEQLASTVVAANFEAAPIDFNVDIQEEPENSISYQANFARLARGGMSACADFYYASPYGLINGDKRGSAYLDPVVRVTTTDAVFLTLINHFSKN